MRLLSNTVGCSRLVAALAAGLTFAATATPSTALADEQNGDSGAVLVQTNDISENSILAYARSADGTLRVGRYPTLGRGRAPKSAPRPTRSRRRAR
jgi:hypothetical protein